MTPQPLLTPVNHVRYPMSVPDSAPEPLPYQDEGLMELLAERLLFGLAVVFLLAACAAGWWVFL